MRENGQLNGIQLRVLMGDDPSIRPVHFHPHVTILSDGDSAARLNHNSARGGAEYKTESVVRMCGVGLGG